MRPSSRTMPVTIRLGARLAVVVRSLASTVSIWLSPSTSTTSLGILRASERASSDALNASNGWTATLSGRSPGVLLWDIQPASRLYRMMRDKVRASGIRTHEVSEILPGYPNQHARDELSPYDTHPSASAQRAVGAWIVRTLLPAEK